MTSVQRMLDYVDLESEGSTKTEEIQVPELWGKEGVLRFQNVSLTYGNKEEAALSNISLTISPGTKVITTFGFYFVLRVIIILFIK